MAVFRDGVKIGKFDVRTGLSKKRVQDLAKKVGLIEGYDDAAKIAPYGELDAIRAVISKQEGFMRPNSFAIAFNPPRGLRDGFTTDTLEKDMAKRNRSQDKQIQEGFKAANAVAGGKGGLQGLSERYDGISKLNIMCSKVTVPERTFDVGLYRHYGPAFAYPKGVQYGTLTTTFYADGVMQIKKFFDQWQNLIYNPMSGNFNYYNEYTSSFDIFNITTVGNTVVAGAKGSGGDNLAQQISGAIKNFSKSVDEFFGSNDDRIHDKKFNFKNKVADAYGCRIFECWPSTVGQIEFDHGSTDAIGTFDVTWAYRKWVPFGFSGISSRSEVNLSVGEFRMEKNGIPFLEDLPPELSGPLGGAIDQGISTAPIGGITKGKIFF